MNIFLPFLSSHTIFVVILTIFGAIINQRYIQSSNISGKSVPTQQNRLILITRYFSRCNIFQLIQWIIYCFHYMNPPNSYFDTIFALERIVYSCLVIKAWFRSWQTNKIHINRLMTFRYFILFCVCWIPRVN